MCEADFFLYFAFSFNLCSLPKTLLLKEQQRALYNIKCVGQKEKRGFVVITKGVCLADVIGFLRKCKQLSGFLRFMIYLFF